MGNMLQYQLPINGISTGVEHSTSNYYTTEFSAEGLCDDNERKKLEEKYFNIIHISDAFDRQSVSYQLSKKDIIHSWIKYKEGYSSNLVSQLLYEFNIQKGCTILDPFIGSGTTALVAQSLGINCIGYDVMPISHLAIAAKSQAAKFIIKELINFLDTFCNIKRPITYKERVRYIKITESAYPLETEYDISFYTEFINDLKFSENIKILAKLCLLSCLEDISFTAKDGQYLRWDIRSEKVIEANNKRISRGLTPFKVILDKGELPSLRDIFIKKIYKNNR